MAQRFEQSLDVAGVRRSNPGHDAIPFKQVNICEDGIFINLSK